MNQMLRDHPVATSSALIAVGSLLALRPLISAIPLIAFLVILRISTQYIVPRPHGLWHLFYLWIAATAGCIVSFASAGSTAVASVIPTLVYSASFTLLGFVPFFIAAKMRLGGFFFPAAWATWWGLITVMSPVGRLGVWSPIAGGGTYSWMRPYFGEIGIDWVVGGWTEVLSYFITWHLMGGHSNPQEQEEERHNDLLSDDMTPLLPRGKTDSNPKSSYRMTFLVTALVAFSIPSSFINPLPLPLHDENARQIGVACALPEITDLVSPFDAYIKETRTLTNQAHVVVWPEGAVYFDSEADRNEKLEWVRGNASISGASIAVSFTEPATIEERGKRSGKRRNGVAIVNRDGVVLEYYKRHLVPLVESFPQVAGTAPPPIISIKEGSKKHPNQQFNFTVTTNICLDFAHPLHDLSSRPTLILGPARTWHLNVAQIMLEMARQRADELGTRILWCDGGEQGLSGIVGMGESGVQVGRGSWVRYISVELPLNEARTLYATRVGDIDGLFGAWVFFFLTWVKIPRLLGGVGTTVSGLRGRAMHFLRREREEPNLLGD